MPGGSAARQNYNPESQDEIGNSLARNKAKDAGDSRTAANDNDSPTVANDNYNPYSEDSVANENNSPTAANDNNYSPYTEGPSNNNNVPQEEDQPSFSPAEEAWFQNNTRQEEMDANQQNLIAATLAGERQRQLRQLQSEEGKIEDQLKALEKDLTSFKGSKLGKVLKIFQPRMNLLIDILISEMKKQAGKLTDEMKIGFYNGLIDTVSALIGMFTAIRMFAGFLDAAFIDRGSCLRLVIVFSETIVIPIILILISPIFIPFLALIFIMGKIPLLKGTVTKNIVDIIVKLKKQRDVWRVELNKTKKKVALRKQRAALRKMKQQIINQRH